MTKLLSLDLKTVAELLPKRNANSNKGTFGKTLLICGSRNMVGCCVLATLGALRSGVGIVKLAFPDCLYNSLTTRLTENLFIPLKTDEDGFISRNSISDILTAAELCDTVAVGCGLGTGEGVKSLLQELVLNCDKPLIIDADGLNSLSHSLELLRERKGETLLTPHPAEMARLFKTNVVEIEKNREKAVTDFSRKYNVNILLKGHETLICNKNVDTIYINKTGNTGLSKGGSGDLLTGIIAGLSPQLKGDLFTSAAVGAFIHGFTADLLKEELTEYSMLPSDCATALPRAFSEILKLAK